MVLQTEFTTYCYVMKKLETVIKIICFFHRQIYYDSTISILDISAEVPKAGTERGLSTTVVITALLRELPGSPSVHWQMKEYTKCVYAEGNTESYGREKFGPVQHHA